LEDTRIRLATERDFYPKLCFKKFLATAESREKMRLAEDRTNLPSDGLTDLEATVDSIYAFVRDHAVTGVGMCSKVDLAAFLAEFMKQRMAGVNCEHLSADRLTYLDFLAMVAPKNRDFAHLLTQRQTDFDLQTHENAYIKSILSQKESTSCRLARPVFIEAEMHSNVP